MTFVNLFGRSPPLPAYPNSMPSSSWTILSLVWTQAMLLDTSWLKS